MSEVSQGYSQVELWDRQHFIRGSQGIEGTDLKYTPNASAKVLNRMLRPGSTILEIGCANGRDARYLATQGHSVIACDFSKVALTQLEQLAKEQQVSERIVMIEHDISLGGIPIMIPGFLDAFYARSSLHIDDGKMFELGHNISVASKPGSIVFIEGKGPNDFKIQRSAELAEGLVVDYDGHNRRVWTEEFSKRLCEREGWKIEELRLFEELVLGKKTSFLRMVARV